VKEMPDTLRDKWIGHYGETQPQFQLGQYGVFYNQIAQDVGLGREPDGMAGYAVKRVKIHGNRGKIQALQTAAGF
jgi:hypothetical protein